MRFLFGLPVRSHFLVTNSGRLVGIVKDAGGRVGRHG